MFEWHVYHTDILFMGEAWHDLDVGVRRKQRDDYVRDRKRRGRNKDKGKKKRRKDNQRMRHAKMTEKGAKVFFFFLLKLYIYRMRVIYTTNVARLKLCFHPTNMWAIHWPEPPVGRAHLWEAHHEQTPEQVCQRQGVPQVRERPSNMFIVLDFKMWKHLYNHPFFPFTSFRGQVNCDL